MHLMFAKDHIDTPQCYWENVLWTDKPKAKLFGENTVTQVNYRIPHYSYYRVASKK